MIDDATQEGHSLATQHWEDWGEKTPPRAMQGGVATQEAAGHTLYFEGHRGGDTGGRPGFLADHPKDIDPPGYSCATAPDFTPPVGGVAGSTGFAVSARSIRGTGA